MSDNPKKPPKKRKGWVRAIRAFIRWTWIPVTCVAALAVGLCIGYVYIGKQDMNEVFELGTWRHLFDLVFADT
ncbi:DNA-directed RNA polymerase subunit beta [Paenibacillus cremeus]|uniref:DNA-directed RNA polymerase subunit beta n=1 Tax=Paenibacillus cremeus TaxID=2163881 RepID=UPI0021BD9A9E|nr:DNA-directed RNA polymerase subunit beta [Paenibacillus cremeus]